MATAASETPAPESTASTTEGTTEMQVLALRIRTLDRQTYSVSIPSDASVPQLKELVATTTGVVFDRQRLIFRGRVLQNDQKIAAYALEDGHVLHLVARADPVPSATASSAAPSGNPRSASGPSTSTAETTTPGLVPGLGANMRIPMPMPLPQPDRIVMGARIMMPEGAEMSMPALSSMLSNFFQHMGSAAANGNVAVPNEGAPTPMAMPPMPMGTPIAVPMPLPRMPRVLQTIDINNSSPEQFQEAMRRLRDDQEAREAARAARRLQRENRTSVRRTASRRTHTSTTDGNNATMPPTAPTTRHSMVMPPLPIAARMLRNDVDAHLRDMTHILNDQAMDFQGLTAEDLDAAIAGDASVVQSQWRQLITRIGRLTPHMERVPVALRELQRLRDQNQNQAQSSDRASAIVDAVIDTLDTLQRMGEAATTMARFARGLLVEVAPTPEGTVGSVASNMMPMQGAYSVMPISIDLIQDAPMQNGNNHANARSANSGPLREQQQQQESTSAPPTPSTDNTASNAGGVLQSLLDRVAGRLIRHHRSRDSTAASTATANSTSGTQASVTASTPNAGPGGSQVPRIVTRSISAPVPIQASMIGPPTRSPSSATWDLATLWATFSASVPASVVLGILRGDTASLQRAFRVLCALLCENRYAPHPSQWPLARWSEQFLQHLRQELLQHVMSPSLLDLLPNRDQARLVDEIVAGLAQYLPALLLYVMQSSSDASGSAADANAQESIDLMHRIAEQVVRRLEVYLGDAFEPWLQQWLESRGVEHDLSVYVEQAFIRWAHPTTGVAVGQRRPRDEDSGESGDGEGTGDASHLKRPRTQ